MSKQKTLLICVSILVVGGIITTIIFLTEPTAKRAGATKETAMLVDVVNVQRDTFQPTIVATGTVQPAQEITLSPRVSGRIIKRSHEFIPGGYVQEGKMLLRIDPADYQNNLEQQRSDLRQALADLNIEMGRQDVARQDYRLISDTLLDNLSEQNQSLILREPQLESVKANVEAARAAVQQAKLNLERTTIEAPFDAHIIRRNVNVGSQVAPGDNLGRLVGLGEYWVVTTVPLSKLNWLTFPSDNESKGAKVRIRDRTVWAKGQYRTGHLYKRIGTLEDKTRMARILVSVPDPLGYRTDTANLPTLMIGSFVQTHINAREIPNVVRLNRNFLRENETVWVMKDKKLDIRDVDIVFMDNKYAYIRDGLKDGEKVVTTNLSTVVDGSPLRLGGADTISAQDTVQQGN